MVKVIASSVRKGNVLEVDGKLCIVMKAENIHPGKGTPVTHLDMRRISDGVKITERYRTTDQVERAYLEDKTYNYLFEDDTGYTFMTTAAPPAPNRAPNTLLTPKLGTGSAVKRCSHSKASPVGRI